ncbi:class I SAM-dependent methyltransferase [Sporichthya polymorpha]|uniref:class I SAM-dependent methyltransferase n=1 Tax=Sporichthya polymorpha TaxID=35751 RepID=UPI000382A854|nr:class I SAM-dependent methyltransferase [Sporichthya polymorpha]
MSTPFDGEAYAARIAALAATGQDMHGEANFVAALVEPGARILDAGCGTGRVGARLAELGFDVAGADVDASMLAVARRIPGVRWYLADLAELDLSDTPDAAPFDLVVAAGNVFPFLAPGTGARVLERLAAHLRPDGLLVSGFGLDRAHLPAPAATVPIEDYDAWCAAAGLTAVDRRGTWDGDPWTAAGGYAVSVHRRTT